MYKKHENSNEGESTNTWHCFLTAGSGFGSLGSLDQNGQGDTPFSSRLISGEATVNIGGNSEYSSALHVTGAQNVLLIRSLISFKTPGFSVPFVLRLLLLS